MSGIASALKALLSPSSTRRSTGSNDGTLSPSNDSFGVSLAVPASVEPPIGVESAGSPPRDILATSAGNNGSTANNPQQPRNKAPNSPVVKSAAKREQSFLQMPKRLSRGNVPRPIRVTLSCVDFGVDHQRSVAAPSPCSLARDDAFVSSINVSERAPSTAEDTGVVDPGQVSFELDLLSTGSSFLAQVVEAASPSNRMRHNFVVPNDGGPFGVQESLMSPNSFASEDLSPDDTAAGPRQFRASTAPHAVPMVSHLEMEALPGVTPTMKHVPTSILRLLTLVSLSLPGHGLSQTSILSDLSRLPSLRFLRLPHNKFRVVPHDLISSPAAKNFEVLDFSFNSLSGSGFGDQSINHMRSLRILKLRNNFIQRLPSGISHLFALESLDFGHNNLASLIDPLPHSMDDGSTGSTGALADRNHMPALRYLDVSFNAIEASGLARDPSSWMIGILEAACSLQVINLERNQSLGETISAHSDGLGAAPSFWLSNALAACARTLRVLNVSCCALKGVLFEESIVLQCVSLEQLKCRANKLTSLWIDSDLTGATSSGHARAVLVSDSSLNGAVLPALQVLDIHDNDFIQGTPLQLSKTIRILDVGENIELSFGASVAERLPRRIQRLSIAGCRFPQGFDKLILALSFLKDLVHLDLAEIDLSSADSDCPFNASSDEHVCFPVLQVLVLRKCNLRFLPSFIAECRRLRFLDVSDNRMVDVSMIGQSGTHPWSSVPKLRVLLLHSSFLTVTLSGELPRSLSTLSFANMVIDKTTREVHVLSRMEAPHRDRLLSLSCSDFDGDGVAERERLLGRKTQTDMPSRANHVCSIRRPAVELHSDDGDCSTKVQSGDIVAMLSLVVACLRSCRHSLVVFGLARLLEAEAITDQQNEIASRLVELDVAEIVFGSGLLDVDRNERPNEESLFPALQVVARLFECAPLIIARRFGDDMELLAQSGKLTFVDSLLRIIDLSQATSRLHKEGYLAAWCLGEACLDARSQQFLASKSLEITTWFERIEAHRKSVSSDSAVRRFEGALARLLTLTGEHTYFHFPSVRQVVPRSEGQGVRILALDGGGTRAFVTIEILQALERMTGQRICDMFDIICGTSTGSILSALLGIAQVDAKECERLYKVLMAKVFCVGQRARKSAVRAGSEVFAAADDLGPSTSDQIAEPTIETDPSAWGKLVNLSMLWGKGGYYPTDVLNRVLREVISGERLIDLSSQVQDVKFFATSTISSCVPPLPYLFRNYALSASTPSRYRGDCVTRLPDSLCASAAAPTYFEAMHMRVPREQPYGRIPESDDTEQVTLMDGGLLINNPTMVAIHESAKLFPGIPVSCIVSLGTGGSPIQAAPDSGFLKTLLRVLVKAATNAERSAYYLDDVLEMVRTHGAADDIHVLRYNPVDPAFQVELDETRDDKIASLQHAARQCIERDMHLFKDVGRILSRPKMSRKNVQADI